MYAQPKTEGDQVLIPNLLICNHHRNNQVLLFVLLLKTLKKPGSSQAFSVLIPPNVEVMVIEWLTFGLLKPRSSSTLIP